MTSLKSPKKPKPEAIIQEQNDLDGFLVKGRTRICKPPKYKRDRPQIAPTLISESEEIFVETKQETMIPQINITQNMPRVLHKCEVCDYTNSRKYLVIRHSQRHTNDRPLKCPICAQGLKTAASLANHVRLHTGAKPYQCKQCDGSYRTSSALVRHVKYKHTMEKPHQCTLCDYASVEASKLRRHMTCHTGERPHQCQQCTYSTSDMSKLKCHLRKHSCEKLYTCKLCNINFTQSNSLKSHLQMIHKKIQKPMYSCEICLHEASCKANLRIHKQKMHENIWVLKCKRCSLSFTDKYSLRVHCNTHKGKEFRCSSCPYVTDLKHNLDLHINTHTGQKLFQCGCGQTFGQEQLLCNHRKICHNPDNVSPLDESICHKSDYVSPLPIKRNYKCDKCKGFFYRKDDLVSHIQAHETKNQTEGVCVRTDKTPVESDAAKEIKANDDEPLFEVKTELTDSEEGDVCTLYKNDTEEYIKIEVSLEENKSSLQAVCTPQDVASRDENVQEYFIEFEPVVKSEHILAIEYE